MVDAGPAIRAELSGELTMPNTIDQGAAHRAALLQRMTRTGLYLVTDDRLDTATLLARLGAALDAGADVVQFRDKRDDLAAVAEAGRQVAARCREAGALFIVNDHAQLAVDFDADGIHVGQDDAAPGTVRAIVGPNRIIGLSISHLHELDAAVADPELDHIGFGALYGSPTKTNAEPAGPAMLAEARKRVPFPIVGIGGVTASNLGAAFAAGADAVAVVSAMFSAPDPAAATRDLLAAIEQARAARG
jgi:thiamine-phosphate diphosphorylase